MENNSIVMEMIHRSAKDFNFKNQIQNSKTSTKEFINSVMKTFEVEDLK